MNLLNKLTAIVLISFLAISAQAQTPITPATAINGPRTGIANVTIKNNNMAVINNAQAVCKETKCDDGDDCTVNDLVGPNCICAGTLLDDDKNGICDKDDQSDDCNGTLKDPCDDGDPCTTGDYIGPDCTCIGAVVLDCATNGNNISTDHSLQSANSATATTVETREAKTIETGLTIYPNPSSENITLTIGQNLLVTQATVQIFSTQGDLVYEDNVAKASSVIDVTEFPMGTYVVLISNGSIVENQMFIKN